MAWISVHQQIRDHRKIRDLYRKLKINRAEAIGTLTLIWTWAVDNCNQEGELLSVIKEDIADAAYWRGDPNVLYDALVETGWIDEHDGKMYLHDWYDFNKPFYDYIVRKERDKQRKRAASAETPTNSDGNSTGNSAEIPQENRGEFHDSHSPAPSHSPSPAPSHLNNLFARFWDAYPKKKSKGQAEKAFAKLKVDEQFLEVILAAIERAKKSTDWQKENGQFIPYPATWLNAKGWEDEQNAEEGKKNATNQGDNEPWKHDRYMRAMFGSEPDGQ